MEELELLASPHVLPTGLLRLQLLLWSQALLDDLSTTEGWQLQYILVTTGPQTAGLLHPNSHFQASPTSRLVLFMALCIGHSGQAKVSTEEAFHRLLPVTF